MQRSLWLLGIEWAGVKSESKKTYRNMATMIQVRSNGDGSKAEKSERA